MILSVVLEGYAGDGERLGDGLGDGDGLEEGLGYGEGYKLGDNEGDLLGLGLGLPERQGEIEGDKDLEGDLLGDDDNDFITALELEYGDLALEYKEGDFLVLREIGFMLRELIILFAGLDLM